MANPNPPAPPRLETIAQLQEKLNSTKHEHNGYGYDDLINLYDSGLNISNLALAFGGVARTTMRHWLTILDKGV